jgi:hypothetical protein
MKSGYDIRSLRFKVELIFFLVFLVFLNELVLIFQNFSYFFLSLSMKAEHPKVESRSGNKKKTFRRK